MTAKKCTKTRAARAELLFCYSKPFSSVSRSRCRRLRGILNSLLTLNSENCAESNYFLKKTNISFSEMLLNKWMSSLFVCFVLYFVFVFAFVFFLSCGKRPFVGALLRNLCSNCITLIQGTNDILFASFCLSLFNTKIYIFSLRFHMSTRGSKYVKWIGYRKKY